jgi:hypothetical protein
MLKPPSKEQVEEKTHLKNVVKINAIRNMRENDPELMLKKKAGIDINENMLGAHKLSAEQIKKIYELIDKR